MRLQQAALALAQNRVSSRDLVEACLERIADPEGQGSAAFITRYEAQARAQADASDQLRQAGRAPSQFAGIPISIKDLFDVAGEVTTAGSVALREDPPATETAPAINRLLAAGLILVGRTNMTEFAFSGVGMNPHYGTPLSPYDRAAGRIPGGSSSGAAVSVADGMALAAIGTDTGGSCRIPAALCGIVGFKPTARRVPLAGALPLSPTLDSIGPLAASVACAATMDAILAGDMPRALPDRAAAGLRLALPLNMALDGMDAATERALDRAVGRLENAGVAIDRRHFAPFDDMLAAHARGGFAVLESYAWHRDLLNTKGDLYDPRVASRIRPGAEMSAVDYFRLVQARARVIEHFEAAMEPYDALLMPTVPIAPPPLAAFATDSEYFRLNGLLLRNPAAINFFDGCAITLPIHPAGAPPAGLMLAAPALADAGLFAVAAAVERVVRLQPGG